MRLPPDQRLVERELIEQIGASRTTVCEVLHDSVEPVLISSRSARWKVKRHGADHPSQLIVGRRWSPELGPVPIGDIRS